MISWYQYTLVQVLTHNNQVCSEEKHSEVTPDSGDTWCWLIQWLKATETLKVVPTHFSCQQQIEIAQVDLSTLEKSFSLLRAITKVLFHPMPLTSALKKHSLFLRVSSKSTEITPQLQVFGCVPVVSLELKLIGSIGKITYISKVMH